MAVVDESVDPLPELRMHRVTEFPLPPQTTWQIRIESGENDAWQLCRASAFEQEGNLFGANLFLSSTAHMTMRVDPCTHPLLFRIAIGFDNNRAASVVLGDLRHQLGVVVQGTRLFAVSGKIHKRCPRHCA